jgi:acyl-CoA thioesterase-2
MTTALDDLVALLDLEAIDDDIFRGRSPAEERQRVFGGQVAAQALVAAGRTVPDDRPVHSLHAYFLRPGDPRQPIVYLVDRIREGRSFTTRRVVAVQHGQPIFNLSASFHRHEEGIDHQAPRPEVPDPETLAPFSEQMAPYAELLGPHLDRPRPIDHRFVDPPSLATIGTPRSARLRLWLRADGRLPEDHLVQACVLAYASDLTLLDTVLIGHGLHWSDRRLMGASLDHAMWFHRPFRADEWLLYDQSSPTAHGARALAEGAVYDRAGQRVATVVQEGLLRLRAERPPRE